MGTPFSAIYDRFFGKITDDMYLEWTREDTEADLENILMDAIPLFEFPLFDLYDYGEVEIDFSEEVDCCCKEKPRHCDCCKKKSHCKHCHCPSSPPKKDCRDIIDLDNPPERPKQMQYNCDLSPEEINLLAVLMYNTWLQRQIASVENTRMKYSGSDFKMTSQANHLDKLIKLKQEAERQAHHLQRLYKRRRRTSGGNYKSNWSSVMEKSVFGDNPVPWGRNP